MHVLLFGPVPPPHGGVQTHLMALRRHLQARSVRVSVINITRHRKADGDGIYYPHSAAGLLLRVAQLRPDVLHVHLGGDLSRRDLALCLACSLIPGSRSVLTFHSGGFPSSPAGLAASPASGAGRVLQRLDAVIGVNEAIAETFRRFGCRPDRIAMIEPHTALPVGEASGAPWPARFAAFAAAHAPVLLTVGGLEPEYGLEPQIAALERIRAVQPRAGLIIVGSGSLETALRRQLAASPVGEHVLLAGDVPHEETLAAIARCDLLLRPTAYDGDSVSVREALALGTPVLATDTGMRPAGVHLLASRTPEAIAEGTLRLAGARQAAIETEGSENLERVLAVYQRLLGLLPTGQATPQGI